MSDQKNVRTSATDPLRIDWFRGRVGMTFAPGKQTDARAGFRWERDLDADLDRMLEDGATVLVGLLTDSELRD
jgi:hypothetical protein